MSAAMLEPLPGLLSTTTGWPSALAKRVAHRARHEVGRAGGREADHEPDRLVRIGRRLRPAAAPQAASASASRRGRSASCRLSSMRANRQDATGMRSTILPTWRAVFHARLGVGEPREVERLDRSAAGCGRPRSAAAPRRRSAARPPRAAPCCAACWRRRTPSGASHAARRGRSRHAPRRRHSRPSPGGPRRRGRGCSRRTPSRRPY